MTTEEELDFSNICRVCCMNGTLLSLFKVHLNRKLMACANITVGFYFNKLFTFRQLFIVSYMYFTDMER